MWQLETTTLCLIVWKIKWLSNQLYNVLHIPEEDIISKYSDDKLEEKLNEVKEEQQIKKNIIYKLMLIKVS